MTVGFDFLESLWPSEPERLEWTHTLPYQESSVQHQQESHTRLAWSSLDMPELGANSHHHHSPNTQSKRISRNGLIGGKGNSGCHMKPRVTPPDPPVLSEKNEETYLQNQEKTKVCTRSRDWVREHIRITQKHSSGRDPLPDKGKPAVRQGRKATGQVSDLTAGLPDEE